MISREQLKKSMPHATDANIDKFLSPLNQAMFRYGIILSPKRIATFLSNISLETKELSAMSENLNYSANRLLQIFPKHFTSETAKQYANKPWMIAGKVYANRYGNGNEVSGDGWRYRGRGGMMLTFKDNYEAAGNALDYDFVSNPDDVTKPGAAMMTAAWYWESRHLNELADNDNYLNICELINGVNKSTGKPNGWTERLKNLEICKAALI